MSFPHLAASEARAGTGADPVRSQLLEDPICRRTPEAPGGAK